MTFESTSKQLQGITIPEDVAPLFKPYDLGPFHLKHRLPHMIQYYSDRASDGGLLLSEATIVLPEGQGYPETPGIFSQEQVEAWKPIAAGVKAKGGIFFCQLWHVGRASHPDYQPDGRAPPSASAVPVGNGWDDVYTPKGAKKMVTPRALELSELPGIVAAYAAGAKNALDAGFAGVEVHGANGYLLDQFTKDGSNKRTDEYGGAVENRARLLLEVVAAVVQVAGEERVGIRLSPFNPFLDCEDSDPVGTFTYVVTQLAERFPKLSYVHMVEPRVVGDNDAKASTQESLEPFRKAWPGTFIVAGGFTRDSGAAAVRSGEGDLVAYGRVFLANPDLPKRFALDAPLNKYDRSTFYIQDPVKGYNDYPFLEEGAAAQA